ncbi:hypothetical protein Tco_1200595 [Tanacetum coccineum]
MSSMRELSFFLGLQVQQKKKGIFISQDKYVNEILRKYNYTDVKYASTPTDLEKPLVQDGDAVDVDEHLYRSMIGSLMYLIASRPDIMFAVSACARFQVSPKTSYLLAVKRIFRYLKGKPSLGLWYSKDSPLELVAYTDSNYARATQDRKSTTRGCQFLGNRLISWQCKKQTMVATSTTKAEYVTAASCCRRVLWIQNQLLDYGYNFMNTIIYIDNNSTICIIENPVQHSKTKHIEIRHHFIRDCNAKKLIQMAKIDTKHNVATLLIKGFNAGRFQYFVSISTAKNGEVKITATIDGHSMTITEGSLRRHLKLDDQDGISSIPNSGYLRAIGGLWDITQTQIKHHFPTPHDSPLHVVHSHGSDEGSLKLNELMNLVTKLSDRIGVLEDDLKKTKKTYSSAYTKLILRVKKLERGEIILMYYVQEKASTETAIYSRSTPIEFVTRSRSSEKGSEQLVLLGAKKGRSARKGSRQDKEKAIMNESEPKKEDQRRELEHKKG